MHHHRFDVGDRHDAMELCYARIHLNRSSTLWPPRILSGHPCAYNPLPNRDALAQIRRSISITRPARYARGIPADASRMNETDTLRGTQFLANSNLSSFIWSVADLLRGDYKQSEYGKVILPFTVLRRLDLCSGADQGGCACREGEA